MQENRPEVDSSSIRYQGKAVDDSEWIVEFLAERETGVLGLIDQDQNEPHLLTQLFVYDDAAGALFVHGARAGRAHDLVEDSDGARACFTTSEMGRYIPADEPVNFTVEYASVVAYGEIELLEERAEKRRVLETFMAKFAPHLSVGEDYEEMTTESIDRTAVYRLEVERWSAKQGEKPPAYPGAYELDGVRDSR
ncbi:pyridoxamine 5'-phosphate oxidase family protein [Natronorubrum sulfidifaciens]|uniref:Pyridoxamine 5'-phosphate oxidase-related FMN-binding protein n=1 Tax=Natronorubrum sulfidifaciens JCM 14089 TaxID=1230460 RepID=L9W6T3_9EURY|nr:pyridoxamine 5'-phosphate oxidase family protein [Natronorubrum sulfidifaciens]ELY44976.1 pyridoxamine 5'-phosphate oxidase-related FMN-binding protein [Natronorubrum sulfidifaciens JCM 14089]